MHIIGLQNPRKFLQINKFNNRLKTLEFHIHRLILAWAIVSMREEIAKHPEMQKANWEECRSHICDSSTLKLLDSFIKHANLGGKAEKASPMHPDNLPNKLNRKAAKSYKHYY